MESGYDDIEFITSVTKEELIEIGIVKKGSMSSIFIVFIIYVSLGHIRRFERGILELNELLKTETVSSPYPSTNYHIPTPSSPSHSVSNLSSSSQNFESTRASSIMTEPEGSIVRESEVKFRASSDVSKVSNNAPSVDSGIEVAERRKSVNFNKMKHLLEKRMGIPVTGELAVDDENDNDECTPCPSPSPPVAPPTAKQTRPISTNLSDKSKSGGPPPPVPRRAVSTVLTGKESPLLQNQVMTNNDSTDQGNGGSLTVCVCVYKIRN